MLWSSSDKTTNIWNHNARFHLELEEKTQLPRDNRNNTDGNEAQKSFFTCFCALGKHFDGSFSPKEQ